MLSAPKPRRVEVVFFDPIIRFQFQRAAEHLCVLGPRPLAELLAELGMALASIADRVLGVRP